jgi:hypothetical protein
MKDRNRRNRTETTSRFRLEHPTETTETPPYKRGLRFRSFAKAGIDEAELEKMISREPGCLEPVRPSQPRWCVQAGDGTALPPIAGDGTSDGCIGSLPNTQKVLSEGVPSTGIARPSTKNRHNFSNFGNY